MSIEDMTQVLRHLPIREDENVIIGEESMDDAAVYRLEDGSLIVHTVDVFSPIVDDPVVFGRIVAANSMSDVYAMGGTPLLLQPVCLFQKTRNRHIARCGDQGGCRETCGTWNDNSYD